jgi:3-oxoacyl-[acyl-carrier-protein] synthase-1
MFAVGHASALLALSAACQKIRDGAFDAFVVAGADSYIAADTLEWLEANDQLHGAGSLKNAWGFVPGEGAGAALLVHTDAVERLGLEPFARVLGVGIGFEQNRIKTETVCVGEGLTMAFRAALAGLPPGERVTDAFCDMNGEPYRADEFGFAYLRTKDAFVSAEGFIAPADCWGDVSAATVPLNIALSTISARKAYAKGRYAFLWCSSEGGERGAALLELPRSAEPWRNR